MTALVVLVPLTVTAMELEMPPPLSRKMSVLWRQPFSLHQF